MDEIDEVVANVVAMAREPRTVEGWARTENGGWRHWAVTVTPTDRTYFIQGVPVDLAEMEPSDLDVFAYLHAEHPIAREILTP